MSVLGRLLGALGWRTEGPEEEEETYRCIRCGSYFDKDYHTCPACGAQFVAPVEGEPEDAPPDPTS